jgi:antitoxin PrlF
MLESRMTQKGQVTIPVDIREKLGLQPGDVVLFEEHEGSWIVRPRESRLASIYGAVTPRAHPENWHEVRDAVDAAVARDVAGEG